MFLNIWEVNKISKKRYIDTKFWDDTYIVERDPVEKLLYLYLLTNTLTNICGIYEISLRRIAFDTGIDKDMVIKILERFEQDDKMKYESGYIIIKNFTKHQKDNPSINKGINILLKEIPIKLITWADINTDRFIIKNNTPTPLPIQTPTNNNTNNNSNDNSNSNSKEIIKPENTEIINFVNKFIKYQKEKYPKLVSDKPKDVSNSIETIDKLIRINNFTLTEIQSVLAVAVIDDFWQDKIMSLVSLRKLSKNGQMKFQNIYRDAVPKMGKLIKNKEYEDRADALQKEFGK